jgi:ABC-type transport system involved in multi-copper enzyme maturation permease subunit
MAVYKRSYSGYAGAQTPSWSHFLIPARYAITRLMKSKFLVIFVAACMFYPLLCLIYIYVSHNPRFLALLRVPALPAVDGRFFYLFCTFQGTLAYLLASFICPGLVTSDIANGALPLFFCRSFSRTEYVAGKMIVLLSLLSLITWIPALVLFSIQASLEGWQWVHTNYWLATGLTAGLIVWIVSVSLIGLAISALVKRKIAAGALILGVFFAGSGFGSAINDVMRTNTGTVIGLTQDIHAIWSDLLRYDSGIDMPVSTAWLALAVTWLICLVLLNRRIRAFEVIR